MSMLRPLLTSKDVLALSTEGVFALVPENFDRLLTQPEVTHIFDKCGAFWKHNNDPSNPHVLLHAGGHSNGFVNCRLVLSRTNLCRLMASQALRLVREQYDGRIDWPLGSTSAAADLSKDVANLLEVRHDVFTVEGNKQVWKGPQIPEDAVIGQFEELMTTAATTLAVRDGLKAAHGENYPLTYAPFVFTLIHRPDPSMKLDTIEGSPVLYLAHYDIWVVKPENLDQCPLCQYGSEAIPAKGANWQRLKGRA